MSPLLVGVALGATSAFMLDPQQGRRRRELVRDKVEDPRYRATALTRAAGALLLLYAVSRGGLVGIGALAVGAALLGRASANRPITSLGRRAAPVS